MSVTIEYIREPHLEFGGHFLHPDKKTGLAETGPFGCTDPALHPTQIRVGIVGTRATAELCERWVDECRHYIETTKTQRRTMPAGSPSLPEEVDEDVIVEALVKSLTPDFVGMSAESSFATSILTAERWRATFQDREARLIADGDNPITSSASRPSLPRRMSSWWRCRRCSSKTPPRRSSATAAGSTCAAASRREA
jgi:hypothetical protein